MNNENLVSVIIPIYNVPEDLLDQCLKSIFCQTYKNIEIILVDDGTNVNNKEYIRSLTNSNVKIITHKKNCGLYAARITGVKNASGKWICFVDADDHISVDWIRLLVKKAEKENADIVMGNTICEEINENGERTQYVFAPSANFLKNRENILGKDIFSLLMEDEGKFFQLHTVWNKIYSRSLWTRAFQSLLSYQTHLIMTEDILFSTILFFYAEKMSFSDHDGYFYFRNDFSSTKDIYGLKKSIKNFSDLKVSFSSCLNFMVEMGVYETYKKHYKVMKDRYFRWWSNTIKNATQGEYDSEKASLQNDFLTFFEKKKFSDCYDEDSFMDAHRVLWNPRLEIIKKTIANEKNHVISFDIFDTLFVRNTLHPEDILEIISYEKPLLNEYNFKEYRQIAEEICRKNINSTNPSWQDVNLTEIYDSLQELLKIDDATKVDLMQTEIETESKFLMVRGIGKELFELALYLEKEIILISDMYLEENTVLHILSNAGFSGINKLYLSSREPLINSRFRHHLSPIALFSCHSRVLG